MSEIHEASLYWSTTTYYPGVFFPHCYDGWFMKYRDDKGVNHIIPVNGARDISLNTLALVLADCGNLTGVVKVVSSEKHPTCAGSITLRDGKLMEWSS
jgi:hypothetical protein